MWLELCVVRQSVSPFVSFSLFSRFLGTPHALSFFSCRSVLFSTFVGRFPSLNETRAQHDLQKICYFATEPSSVPTNQVAYPSQCKSLSSRDLLDQQSGPGRVRPSPSSSVGEQEAFALGWQNRRLQLG